MPIAEYRNFGCRVTDDLIYKGMRTIFLENDLIRVGVLLDKGADIFQFLHKPSDTDFLWRSPRGLIDPDRVTASRASASGAFLDSYHGGWQEILPGGGPANYRGAELGLHGEVTHLGWDYDLLEDNPERVAIKVKVECLRTPFRLERIMRLQAGKPVLYFEETLSNLSPSRQYFMWGHHPAIGAPFLKEGVRVIVPAGEAEVHSPRFATSGILPPGATFEWPGSRVDGRTIDLSSVPAPDAGYAELVYLKGLSDGWYAVLDSEKRLGIGLAWPLDVFPYLWYWMVFGTAPGYPWWDRVFVIALEPWTSIPNNLDEATARGVQRTIEGGERLNIAFATAVITGRETVRKIHLDGTVE